MDNNKVVDWSSETPIIDGYYWWRYGRDAKTPEIVQICNGMVCDINNGVYREHKDFSGQFAGPIPLPPIKI